MNDGFVDSRGVRIHYLANELDLKRQSLVFVPGIGMPAWIWDKQLDYFSKDYNVVAIEPRSHGDSDQVSEGLHPLEMARDIKEVIQQLKLDQVVLIGWSIAASQAINYAAHMGKLEGLVLVDGIAGIDPSVPFYPSMVDNWKEMQMNRRSFLENFIKNMFKKPVEEGYIQKLVDMTSRLPTNTILNLSANYFLLDFRSLLPKIQIPVWMAVVDGPRLEYHLKVSETFPNAKIEVFKSAGHALFVDQPEKFNHSLEAFLKQI